MNRYIIMTMGITGMGGGQMYVRNKMRYMEEKGWNVTVFGCLRGEIVIPDLKKYNDCTYDELTCAPFVYTKKFVETVINKIINRAHIGKDDNVIIESGTAHMSYWAELLAQRCKGRNLCFLLDERNDFLVDKSYLPFFIFKLRRQELAGINNKSMNILFRGMEKSCIENGPSLPALCQNVVENIEIPNTIYIPKADYTIGSIGRLEKAYVPYMISEVVAYAQEHKNNNINLLLVGGTNNLEIINDIKKLVRDVDNINLIITGYLYPIPQKLFEKVDLFVSSAGSAGVSYGQNVTTISLDAKDGKPIGVLGYTTKNTLYRDNDDIIDLHRLINMITDESYLDKFTYSPKPNTDTSILSKHKEFWSKSNKQKEYYDIMKITPKRKDFAKALFVRILGNRNFLKIKIGLSEALRN